jgi:hypothetical protein
LSLADIASKLRKVKYGDFVLADDHNNLVDAVKLIFDCKYDIPSSDIVSKLRKVKQGDYILHTDHNDLVDSVTLISKWMDFDYTYSDEKYSLTNKGTPRFCWLVKSVYSKKIVTNVTEDFGIYSGLWVEGYTTNVNQINSFWISIHKSNHPPGELTDFPPNGYEDYIFGTNVSLAVDTPTMKKTIEQKYIDSIPNTVYLVAWLETYTYYESNPFTLYVNNFKTFLIFYKKV